MMTVRPNREATLDRPSNRAPAGRLLSVQDLSVRIPTSAGVVHPVNDVSFTVDRGEIVGIIGETGSGKSTIARALIGLLSKPGYVEHGRAELSLDGRTVDLLNRDRRHLRAIRGRTVGFVPQSTGGALNPVLTLERQFQAVLCAHRKMSAQQCRQRAVEVLNLVGIRQSENVLAGYAHQLSGGMAQRVVMAMVLALEPALVVADEPTTGLDVTVQKQLLDELQAMTVEHGRSLLLVTHDMGVVAQYCHRVVVLYGGFVLESGPVDRVLAAPSHPYTELLLGSIPRAGSELSVLTGSVGDLLTLPAGCPFWSRCPAGCDPRCETTRPPLRDLGGGHRSATFAGAGSE